MATIGGGGMPEGHYLVLKTGLHSYTLALIQGLALVQGYQYTIMFLAKIGYFEYNSKSNYFIIVSPFMNVVV